MNRRNFFIKTLGGFVAGLIGIKATGNPEEHRLAHVEIEKIDWFKNSSWKTHCPKTSCEHYANMKIDGELIWYDENTQTWNYGREYDICIELKQPSETEITDLFKRASREIKCPHIDNCHETGMARRIQIKDLEKVRSKLFDVKPFNNGPKQTS